MPIKTQDLGRPENLERLNWLVGKINGKRIDYIGMIGHVWVENKGYELYSPTTNAAQCLEATPRMDISCAPDNKFVVSHESMEFENPVAHESELIARCLALVYSVHGEEVPDEAWEGL